MARRTRLPKAPLLNELPAISRYLSDVEYAVNDLPNFSIVSTADGPNDSGVTGNEGDILIDVGSAVTTVWSKQSGSGDTIGWIELDRQEVDLSSFITAGYVDDLVSEVSTSVSEVSSRLSDWVSSIVTYIPSQNNYGLLHTDEYFDWSAFDPEGLDTNDVPPNGGDTPPLVHVESSDNLGGWIHFAYAQLYGMSATSCVADSTTTLGYWALGTDSAGTYDIAVQVSFSGTGSAEFDVHLQKNGSDTSYGFKRKMGAAGDVGSAGLLGRLYASSGDSFALHVTSGSPTDTDFTVKYAQFSMEKVP